MCPVNWLPYDRFHRQQKLLTLSKHKKAASIKIFRTRHHKIHSIATFDLFFHSLNLCLRSTIFVSVLHLLKIPTSTKLCNTHQNGRTKFGKLPQLTYKNGTANMNPIDVMSKKKLSLLLPNHLLFLDFCTYIHFAHFG